jgi:hypothetical protein
MEDTTGVKELNHSKLQFAEHFDGIPSILTENLIVDLIIRTFYQRKRVFLNIIYLWFIMNTSQHVTLNWVEFNTTIN